MRYLRKDRHKWHQWFAWFPVDVGKHVVWLEYVDRKWNTKKNLRFIDPYDWGDYDGGWDYRETQ